MLAMGIYVLVISLLEIFLTETMVPDQFNAFTGESWSDFSANSPKLAEFVLIVQRLVGIAMFVSSFLAILITWGSYRKGEKWSWYALLVGGIISWGTWLGHGIIVGNLLVSINLAMFIVGVGLFVVGIALPAKAILGKKST